MVSLVQSIARLAQLTFNANKCQSEEVFNESLNKLKKLMSQLTHKDINLNKELMSDSSTRLGSLSILRHLSSKRAPVSHVSICETQHFQMCVFGLRHEFSRIPLHSHPNMFGIIKVVFGSVTISHYSPLPTDSSYILPKEVSKKVSQWERDLLSNYFIHF
jgi:cysteamine dioxygenase